MAKTIDLVPQDVNLKLYSGDGVDAKFTITDKNDAPVNLTGSIRAQIRRTPESTGSPLVSFTVVDTDRTHGVFNLTLDGTDTATLCDGRPFSGYWDVEWTPSGGQPRTLIKGKVTGVVDVSR